MPVRELLRSHTSSELTEWMAYFELEANPDKLPAEPGKVTGAETTKAWLSSMAKKKGKK